MLYSSEEKNSNSEKSRFLTQIEYELGLYEDKDTTKPKFHETKSYEIQPTQSSKIEISKSDNTLGKIKDLLGIGKNNDEETGAAPSLITTYITCPLQFYFKYIEELKKEYDIDDDTSSIEFGNLLHSSCYFLYKDYIGKIINENDFSKIFANIENAIDYAVQKVYDVNASDEKLMQEAKSKIMINPLRRYLKKIVGIDKEYAPFSIIDLENEKEKHSIEYDVNGQKILLRGIIDRIDLKEGVIRVVDYKTSSIGNGKKTYNDTFWSKDKFKSKEAVQILIYSEIIAQTKQEYKKIQPYIYSVTKLYDGFLKCHTINEKTGKKKQSLDNIENYLNQNLLINNEEIPLRKHFNFNLKNILTELLDPTTNITQTDNDDNCEICPYNKICNK